MFKTCREITLTFFVIVFAFGIFFIPCKKPYLDKNEYMSFIEILIDQYKFENKIGEYEAHYVVTENPEDILKRLQEVDDRKANAKDTKSLLEYYSWLGVPEDIKAKMIEINKSLLKKEIVAVMVIGVLVFIFCNIHIMRLDKEARKR